MKDSHKVCLAVGIVIVIIVVVYYLSNKSKESIDFAQTYDHGKQPFALSRQAVDLFMQPAYELCRPRVEAQCGDKPDIACVQKAMIECQQANSKAITDTCVQSLPTNVCSIKCAHGHGAMECQTCLGKAKADGICSMPAISPTIGGQDVY
jgi:hypothetical protein